MITAAEARAMMPREKQKKAIVLKNLRDIEHRISDATMRDLCCIKITLADTVGAKETIEVLRQNGYTVEEYDSRKSQITFNILTSYSVSW